MVRLMLSSKAAPRGGGRGACSRCRAQHAVLKKGQGSSLPHCPQCSSLFHTRAASILTTACPPFPSPSRPITTGAPARPTRPAPLRSRLPAITASWLAPARFSRSLVSTDSVMTFCGRRGCAHVLTMCCDFL